MMNIQRTTAQKLCDGYRYRLLKSVMSRQYLSWSTAMSSTRDDTPGYLAAQEELGKLRAYSDGVDDGRGCVA